MSSVFRPLCYGVSAALLLLIASSAQAQVAVWQGGSLTVEKIEERDPQAVYDAKKALYEVRANLLYRSVLEHLLDAEAERLGLTREVLIEREIVGKAARVTDADVTHQIEKSREVGSRRSPRPGLDDEVRLLLESQAMAQSRQRYAREIFERYGVRIGLAAPVEPPPERHEVSMTERPVLGERDSPVEVAIFSDFQCPYCQRGAQTMRQLQARYGDRVNFVFKHFPIDQLHPQARTVAEAAMCAGDQGKFWAYHDGIFADPVNLDRNRLDAIAAKLALDLQTWSDCVDTGRYATAIKEDLAEGRELGVQATPTWFINGRRMVGAVPASEMIRVIEEELSSAAQADLDGGGDAQSVSGG